ncbi:MAG: hypothetical protein JWQ30_1004 [Sediminibacterium sp.]|nr:hypothetical protein [Sediminibacterium sp.]
MRCRNSFLLLVFVFTAYFGKAQTKNISHLNQVWIGYFNQTRFSNKWGMWTDIHLRTKENFVDNLSQSITRLGLTHYLTDNTKLTFGYAFVNQFPGDNHANISQPEHRIWQQVQWHNKYPRLRLMQWLRLEEKFRHKVLDNDHLAPGYNYNWKLRYNLFFNVPLNKKAFAPNTFSFVLNDEVHVNFGKEIVYNYFDQNRFFIGFSYHTNTSNNIQFGYMNQFQQLATGNNYKSVDVARVFYFHNLDLRKK